MLAVEPYRIDIAAVLRNKLGDKAPKWLICLAKKLLHEDFLNTYFKEGYTGVEFAEKALDYMHIKLQVEGMENIPTDRLVTVASNHPLGGHDALALVSIFGKVYDGNVRILVNDFLMAKLSLVFILFFFFFWPHHKPCRISVPQPRIKSMPPEVEVQSLNPWTAREAPKLVFIL